MPSLILAIELVPQSSWYDNMRKVLSKAEWDRVRKRTYAEYGHKCGICGARKKLHCHERWTYNDTTYMQKLEGFIALCEMCHHIKHIGLAELLASQGKLNMDRVIRHFMTVNKCDRRTFKMHREEVYKKFETRSRYEWLVDLNGYVKE